MNPLVELIKTRIRQKGNLSFADFMEMALYYPGLGYYTSSRTTVGTEGDFYTSTVTHPVFAALLAIQLEQMWHLLGTPSGFTLVEMGAGRDLLGQEVLAYLAHLSPELAQATRYIGLERGQAWVMKKSMTWLERPISEKAAWEALDQDEEISCFFSNELLDALPTHRVVQQDGRLKELYVALKDNAFVESVDNQSASLLEWQLADEGITLPEGYSTEVNPNLASWVRDIAQHLKRGFVITFDYGYSARELYSPARTQGTLMTYHSHTWGTNPYVNIGQQDITSHVDFTAVILSGKRNGLEFWGFTTQREFMLNLGLNIFVEALTSKELGHNEYMANRFSMLELIRPQGLGRLRVLIQGKGIQRALLYGLTPNNGKVKELKAKVTGLEVPMLSREYVSLWSAKYPHASLPEGLSAVLSKREDST